MRQETLDRIGATVSTACALHCALTPLVVSLLAAGTIGWLADERVELAMIGSALVILAVSLWRGCRTHKRFALALFFPGALALLIGGKALGEDSPIGLGLVVTAGLVMAAAHLVNLRLCRSCEPCEADGATAK